MTFELTKELIDQIVFAMEDQEADYVLDVVTLEVVTAANVDEHAAAHPHDAAVDGDLDERYVPVPEWRSVDGYTLMERFVVSLNNPIYREILRRILASGRGVFRQFKDALKEKKEIERLWFNFKEREMRRRIVDWYNIQRDSWGMEQLEIDDEDTAQLVLSDFQIHNATETELAVAEGFDATAFAESYGQAHDALVRYLYARRRAQWPGYSHPASLVRVAVTPSGDFAGFVRSIRAELSAAEDVETVVQLYVVPEYRGLGLATALFEHVVASAGEHKPTTIVTDIPAAVDFLSDLCERLELVCLSTRYAGRIRCE